MAKVPSPTTIFGRSLDLLADPFYDRGPNDEGIGLQLPSSIGRVAAGYLLVLVVAIPLGCVIGMSPLMMRALELDLGSDVAAALQEFPLEGHPQRRRSLPPP
jgi:nitrate/nitrite transport system permease protein